MRFVVIIPPYVVDEGGKAVQPSKAMLPVGPLAIAAALLERGYQVRVIDLVFSGGRWREWLNGVGANDHVLLSCHTVRNISSCQALLAELRAHGFRGHVTLGGNACVELGQAEFARLGLDVDSVIRGYGHGLMDEIIARITGDVWSTPEQVAVALPPPATDLLDEETRQHYLMASGRRYPLVGHGFGCAWSCEYCSAKMGAGWISRPLSEVIEEVKLAKRLGYVQLWCTDNLILVNPERTIMFDQMVVEADLTWSGMDRAEEVVQRREVLSRLQGLASLALGIETTSRHQLTVFGRNARPDTYPVAFELAKQAKIQTVAFVILDCPQTDEVDFWRLYSYLRDKLQPTSVSWSFYNPLPIDGLFQRKINTTDYGFYRWPYGCSPVFPDLVVQEAMLLSGVWWKGWHLNESDPFFGDDNEFGVNFEEGQVFQARTARSPIGDIWEIWKMRNIWKKGGVP